MSAATIRDFLAAAMSRISLRSIRATVIRFAIIASASSPLMLACSRMKSAGSPAIALSSKRAIAAPRNFDRAEAAQMFGDILGVEQLEPACDQPRHQMHQRHFRRVAGAMEHALAEEGPPQADTIEAADEIAVLPDLDAVAVPELVEPDIEIADALVDPGVVAARLRRRAARDDRLEGGVDGHAEGIGAHGAGQPRGDAEAVEAESGRAFPARPRTASGHRRSRPSGRCRRHRPAAAPRG